MKRLALVICCILLLLTSVQAADDTTAITGLTTKITLSADGSSTVTSELQVRFSSAVTSFLIPLGPEAEVVAFDRAYDTATKNDIEYLVLNSRAGLIGEQTFHLTYTLPPEVLAADATQKLNLSILVGGFSCPIEKGATFLIEFPKELTTPPELYSGSHTDNAFSDFEIKISGNSYQATLLLPKMQEYDTLQLKAELPADFFDLRYMPGTTQDFAGYAFWGLTVLCVIYWFFCLRNGLVLPKKRKILPLNMNAGEIGYQITCEKPDLTAMVMQWANLGYLSVNRNRNGRIIFRKRMEMGNERRPLEQKVFYSLFRSEEVCDGSSLRYRSLCQKIQKPFISYWSHRLFERRSGSILLLHVMGLAAAFVIQFMAFDLVFGSFALRWLLIPLLSVPTTYLAYLLQAAVIGLYRRRRTRAIVQGLSSLLALYLLGKLSDCTTYMVLNILLQGLIGLATIFGGRRSRYGSDRLLQLLGFRKYLRNASKSELLHSLQMDAQYFYHTLPYAEMLGLGKRFAKLFGEVQMEPCIWLEDAGGVPLTAGEFFALYAQIVSALRQENRSDLQRTLFSAKQKRNRPGRYMQPRRTPSVQTEPVAVGTAQPLRPHRRQVQEYSPEEYYDE